MNTVFDKIIAREIPASIVYEDEHVIAFLDITPVNKGHTLIVPKKQFINLLDADSDELGYMTKIAQKVARAIVRATNADGINLVMNSEEAAGQEVPHAHMHLIPRFKDDGVFGGYHHQKYAAGEMDSLSAAITKELA